jgi:hypothetical protein
MKTKTPKKTLETLAKSKRPIFDPHTKCLSQEALKNTIGGKIESFQFGRDNIWFQLVASVNGLQVFRDERDNYYIDGDVSLDVHKFSLKDFGEYLVVRQRRPITRREAFKELVFAVTPPEMLDLFSELHCLNKVEKSGGA